jgi:hypothetical protein
MSKKPKKEFLYIGDHFYYESGGRMSNIYLDGQRTDWGKVQIALKQGFNVTIKHAEDSIKLNMQERLRVIKREIGK